MPEPSLVDIVFDGPAVALPQMLDAREARAKIIAEKAALVGESGSVVSITLAIPGPIKTSPVLRYVFQYFYDKTHALLAESIVGEERITINAPTGPEAQFAVSMSAGEVKRLLVAFEEEGKLGRLVDLDVLCGGANPVGISRTELGLAQRKCLICDKPSKECGRARAHTVYQMQHAIADMLNAEGLI